MDARDQLGRDVDLDTHIDGEDLWTSLAGPTAFGRSVFLAAGVDPPHPWANSARNLLNGASLASPATLHALRRAYLRREPVVYEIDPALEIPERGTEEREVWDVPPEADFVAEAT